MEPAASAASLVLRPQEGGIAKIGSNAQLLVVTQTSFGVLAGLLWVPRFRALSERPGRRHGQRRGRVGPDHPPRPPGKRAPAGRCPAPTGSER